VSHDELIEFRSEGIYCPQGNFYIDPWRPVERALITHAHSDHARHGSKHYLAHELTVPQLKYRLGASIETSSVRYGETLTHNGVTIRFHPAGHIVGSAQIRLEHKGRVTVISGDFKTEPDGVSTPFELVKCHTFVTESTFGLPIYQWCEQKSIFEDLHTWWRYNQSQGRASLVLSYVLGKSQRILGNLDPSVGPIFGHGAVVQMSKVVSDSGTPLPKIRLVAEGSKNELSQSLILAPLSAVGTGWTKRFWPYSVAGASGWMAIRGTRRRKGYDRGFALSDHVDWPNLLRVVRDTGAEKIYVTHGYTEAFSRYLNEIGINSVPVKTQFKTEGESLEPDEVKGELQEAAL
jgi:putative mRNA 3-end processing factor